MITLHEEALEKAFELSVMHHTDDGYSELRAKVRELTKKALEAQSEPPPEAEQCRRGSMTIQQAAREALAILRAALDAHASASISSGADKAAPSPLERVIAEQQKEIDFFKKRELSNIESWAQHHKRVDALAQAVFQILDSATPHSSRMLVIEALRAIGYCTYCECNPCECDDER